MAHLSLLLLGTLQALLDGQPATGFQSIKVRALLAYLAVEADRPHSRESLAGLLWPDYPDHSAISNLRYALSNLRQAIGDREAKPPFLLVTRETIQFNIESDYDLDVATFMGHIANSGLAVQTITESAAGDLESAITLYRGNFLEGVSCDSSLFEE